MLDPLPILPFTRPARATVRLPGSKSITNRALILAALAEGVTVLEGALFSEDTRIMIAALRELGFEIEDDAGRETIRIRGEAGRIPRRTATLHVGNAGTAARFLTAFCCLRTDGDYQLDGIPQMRKRPMRGLIDALGQFGARVESANGFFPLRIRGGELGGGAIQVDASESSQMLSALLMVAPFARKPCQFIVPKVRLPFVLMTLQMMEQFGKPVLEEENAGAFTRDSYGRWSRAADSDRIQIANTGSYTRPGAGAYPIEPDVTAASYFATLPLVVGGEINIEKLAASRGGLQGDTAYFDVLEKLGGRFTPGADGSLAISFGGTIPDEPLRVDFSTFSDTFLSLAAVWPLRSSLLRIDGIAHTRKQETDRVAAMATELRKLGQDVFEEEDALEIRPGKERLQADSPHVIDTYHDHRFAMSFAVLGCADLRGDGKPWLEIRDPGCCAKTFPEFFRALESVRQRSHTGPAA